MSYNCQLKNRSQHLQRDCFYQVPCIYIFPKRHQNVTYTQRNDDVSSSADLPECVLWCKNAKYPCYPWETFGSTGLAVHLFFQIIDTRGMSGMQTAWWLLIFSVKILLALTSLVINVLDDVKARTHMSNRRLRCSHFRIIQAVSRGKRRRAHREHIWKHSWLSALIKNNYITVSTNANSQFSALSSKLFTQSLNWSQRGPNCGSLFIVFIQNVFNN